MSVHKKTFVLVASADMIISVLQLCKTTADKEELIIYLEEIQTGKWISFSVFQLV